MMFHRRIGQIKLGLGLFGQPVAFDVGGDGDDLVHGFLAFIAAHTGLDAFANGVLAGKETCAPLLG